MLANCPIDRVETLISINVERGTIGTEWNLAQSGRSNGRQTVSTIR